MFLCISAYQCGVSGTSVFMSEVCYTVCSYVFQRINAECRERPCLCLRSVILYVPMYFSVSVRSVGNVRVYV